MSKGKVLLGVLAGFAAGALIGVLLAPEKGSDLRKKISKKGESYVDELKEKMNEFVESVTDKFTAAKGKANEVVSNAEAKMDEFRAT
jgi:gas vesicle protein